MLKLLIVGVLWISIPLIPTSSLAQSGRHITEKDEKAVVQAVEDEIYDEGCQGYGFDASGDSDHNSYRLPIYVQPAFNDQGLAWAIYKLLPIGEVLRMFSIRGDGIAVLHGHPEWKFPPTEPSYLTVYMDDDQLSQSKHDWLKTKFALDTTPPTQRVRDAQRRQRIRLGENYRNHRRDCSFSWR